MEKLSQDGWPYKRISPGMVLAGFALLFAATTLGFDAYFGWNAYRQFSALSYPRTQGTITLSRLEIKKRDGNRVEHLATIKYSYSVAGKTYEGNRLRYGFGSANRNLASAIVARHPVGTVIPVSYVPESPNESLLYPGIEGSDYFVALCLCPFNLAPLGIIVLLGKRLRARLMRYDGPIAKVYDDGLTLRMRLPPISPSYVAVITVGLAAFFAIFPMVFFYDVYPPKTVIHYVWFVVLGGGGVAYLVAVRRLACSKYDLVIDTILGKVSLPTGYGRQRKVLLSIQQLEWLAVQRVGLPKSGEFFSAYRLTLVFATDNGLHREEQIAQWPVRQQAESVAAWLGERLKIEVWAGNADECVGDGSPG